MTYFDVLDSLGNINIRMKNKILNKLSNNTLLRGKLEYSFRKIKPNDDPIEVFESHIPLKSVLTEMEYNDLKGITN